MVGSFFLVCVCASYLLVRNITFNSRFEVILKINNFLIFDTFVYNGGMGVLKSIKYKVT